ncbi:MAG TPA: octanoyltransferase [bacterium]|nr:octanoyltransferase [bacterium]
MFAVKHLELIEFGTYPPAYNMALDRHLLSLCEADPGRAFLRFYTWAPPALSLGHFEPEAAVDRARAERDGVEIVRRPTGGRIVLHKEDLTYTVVVPRELRASVLDTYLELARCIVTGLAALGATVELARGPLEKSVARAKPCFLSAARHEITYAGRKLVGSAQLVGRQAVLQHGSIPIGRGYRDVANYLACSDAERALLTCDMALKTACLEEAVGRSLAPQAVAWSLGEAFAGLAGGGVKPLNLGTNPLDSLSRACV